MNTIKQITRTTVLLFSILPFLFSKVSYSQSQHTLEEGFSPHFQVGLNGGTSLFFGDIKQYQWWPTANYVSERNLAGGITVNYQAKPSIAIRLQGNYGQLSGTRRDWNTYFINDYFETNINTVINLNNLFGKYRSDRFLSIYGTIGIGLLQYNTEVKILSTDETVAQVGHGYGSGINGRTLQGVIMYGLGLNFNINNRWNLQLETANKTMDSDMLDAYTSGYPLDVYNYTSLGVTYNFGFINKSNDEVYMQEAQEAELAYIPVIMEEDESDLSSETIAEVMVEEVEVEPIDEVEKPEIEYRVQIMAKFRGPLSIDYISTKFLIPKYELKEEIYNGHFIYTVGSFSSYEEARIKRNELRTLYGITDAFIVVFDEGSRLDTIPENK